MNRTVCLSFLTGGLGPAPRFFLYPPFIFFEGEDTCVFRNDKAFSSKCGAKTIDLDENRVIFVQM